MSLLTFIKVIVLVLVLQTQVLVLVLVLVPKSLLTTLDRGLAMAAPSYGGPSPFTVAYVSARSMTVSGQITSGESVRVTSRLSDH